MTTAKYNEMMSQYFDENGQLVNKAGLVTTSNFAELFAQGVSDNGLVKEAEIKAFVRKGDDGYLESGVRIRAGQIDLEGSVTISCLDADLRGTIEGKADTEKLGALAWEDTVEVAKLGSTIIVGGYLNTNYIKVNRIDAEGARVGGFTIEGGRLHWKANDYSGNDSRSLRLGVSSEDTDGVVDVSFNAATTGRFGVKACGANPGGAAVYASRNSGGQTYPDMNNSYAGYFDGGVHVNGNVYCATLVANEIGVEWSMENGTYRYTKGLTRTIQAAGGLSWRFVNGLLMSYG